MTAEQLSASLISRLPLPSSRSTSVGYYRSKLFVAPFTTNPLVAAAGPLLSLLERLSLSPSLPPINTIRDNIEHELLAFHSRLNGKAYTEELDAIAHYLLCATIDELLGKNYLRLYGELTEFHAFTPSSSDAAGPQKRFFDIVNHIKQIPNQYLDLLELAYYCLITGFEGEQHGQANGRQVLDNLIEELYSLIQQHRVNKSHQLFKEQYSLEPVAKKKYPPLIKVGALGLMLMTAGLLITHTLLEKQAKTIQQAHFLLTKRSTNG